MFLFFYTLFLIYFTPIGLDAVSRWVDGDPYEWSGWLWPVFTAREVYARFRSS
jgi:hypothetical protein